MKILILASDQYYPRAGVQDLLATVENDYGRIPERGINQSVLKRVIENCQITADHLTVAHLGSDGIPALVEKWSNYNEGPAPEHYENKVEVQMHGCTYVFCRLSLESWSPRYELNGDGNPIKRSS